MCATSELRISAIVLEEKGQLRCAIMQPTFLPWAGYFRLMSEADAFVFLDDVQLSKQSWQTRNRILVGGAIHWIGVPIRHGGADQTIAETRLENVALWRKKMPRLLLQSYARHDYRDDLKLLVEDIEKFSGSTLGELNCGLVAACAERLDLAPPKHRTSQMRLASQQRTDRLIEICALMDCDCYLSPPGAAEYLARDGFEQRGAVRLEFVDYAPPKYAQKGSERFVSHLSIVDVVANLGWAGAREYIRSPWPVAGAGQ